MDNLHNVRVFGDSWFIKIAAHSLSRWKGLLEARKPDRYVIENRDKQLYRPHTPTAS